MLHEAKRTTYNLVLQVFPHSFHLNIFLVNNRKALKKYDCLCQEKMLATDSMYKTRYQKHLLMNVLCSNMWLTKMLVFSVVTEALQCKMASV